MSATDLNRAYAPGYCTGCGAIWQPEENDGLCFTCSPKRYAVEGGIIKRISVSQIEQFDPAQKGGCNRRWWYVKVDRRKEPQTKAKAAGGEFHKEIDHYCKGGKGGDVLSPTVRAGQRFIPIIARDLGEGWAFSEYKFKNIQIAGVDAEGAIDLLNFSGYTIDDEGDKVIEQTGTIEIVDWKSTSDLAQYAKAGRDLIDTVQMPFYGKLAAEEAERMGIAVSQVRLSHGYFQTGKRGAEKRTALFPLETIRRRWQDITATVEEMKLVARMPSALDVTPNPSACSAYNGCPHLAYCPLSGSQSLASLNAPAPTPQEEQGTMSLQAVAQQQGLVPPGQYQQPAPGQYQQPAPGQYQQPAPGQYQQPAPGPAPGQYQPPAHFQQPAQQYAQPPGQYQQPAPGPSAQEIANQRAALLAEEAQARGQTAPHLCNRCNQPLHQQNTSLLQDGRTLVHIGCPAAPPQVAPPDQPPSNPHTVAHTVPPEALAQLPPAVQQAAAAHNAQHAAYTQQQYQAPAQPQTAPPAPQAQPQTPARGRGRPPGKKKGAAAPADPATGAPAGTAIPEWMLFVDCAPTAGTDAESFDPYLDEIVRGLAAYHKVHDLRSGGDNKSLGYGAWRGSLAAAIRAYAQPNMAADPCHIPAGAYVIYSSGEIAEVGAEALAEIVRSAGGMVVRGRR